MAHAPTVCYFAQFHPELRHSFVRVEIEGLEERGWRVEVVAVRPGTPVGEGGRGGHVRYLPSARDPRFWWLLLCTILRAPVAAHRAVARSLGQRGVISGRVEAAKLLGYTLRGLVLAGVLRTELPEVRHVHVHFDEFPLLAVVVAAHARPGLTYSYTQHTTSDVVGLRWKAEGARFIVTVSDFAEQWLRARLPDLTTPVHRVRCGVRMADWVVERAPVEPPRILSVGALLAVKGHDLLIQAVAKLVAEGVDCRLDVVGEGEARAELEELRDRLELADVVALHGAVSSTRVRDLLRQSSAFALACRPHGSDQDGIPVALMEAMAAGVPVVSTLLSGIPELVEDGVGGWLVPVEDVDALASALRRLLEDERVQDRLARGGLERIAREFTSEQQVERMEHHLRGCLSRS